jgi:hypothetical protein
MVATALVVGALVVWHAASAQERIRLTLPAPEQRLEVESEPLAVYEIEPSSATLLEVSIEAETLVLRFAGGAEIGLLGYGELFAEDRAPSVVIDGEELSAEELVMLARPELALPAIIAPAAGPPLGGADGHWRHAGRRISARRLLLAGESEEEGFGLYSYLLFHSRSSARLALERRKAAMEAFFEEVSSLAEVLATGAARDAINVLYAPLVDTGTEASGEDLARRLRRAPLEERVGVALRRYDYARSRALLARLGLQAEGPFLISHRRALFPVGGTPAPDELLVQDLSRAPPKLVRSWVRHFLGQLSSEGPGVAGRLVAFALRVRTELSVLADGMSVTRRAIRVVLGEEVLADDAVPDRAGGAGGMAASPASSVPLALAATSGPASAPGPAARTVVSPALVSPTVVSPAVESPTVESPTVESPAVESPAGAGVFTDGSGGQPWARVARAREAAREARARLLRAQARLALERAGAQVASLTELLAGIERIADVVERRAEAGVGSRSSRYLVAVEAAELRAALASAHIERSNARAALGGARGETEAPLPGPAADELQGPAEVRRLAAHRHPVVALRTAELAAVEWAARSAAGTTCLDVAAVLAAPGGASLTERLEPPCAVLPLARTEPDTRSIAVARRLLSATVAAAESEGSRLWDEHAALGQRVAALQDAVDAAQTLLQMRLQQFEIGQLGLSTVLETEIRLSELRRSLQAADIDRRRTAYRLLYAVGRL